MTNKNPPVRTPCIGICSTTYGDTVCRGCHRFYHEIVQWNGFTIDQKKLVLSRIDQIKWRILSKYLYIKDEKKLKQSLKVHAIRFDPNRSPWAWINTILGVLEKKGLRLSDFHLAKQPTAAQSDAILVKQIQEEILALSGAFYDLHIQAYRHESLL